MQFLPAPYTQRYIFISPPDCPFETDQPLPVDRQGGGLFPGVEEENLLYQLSEGTPPRRLYSDFNTVCLLCLSCCLLLV